MSLSLKAIGGGIDVELTGEEIIEYRFKQEAPNSLYAKSRFDCFMEIKGNISYMVEHCPDAYISSYKENIDTHSGQGVFTLIVRQKLDKMEWIAFNGKAFGKPNKKPKLSPQPAPTNFLATNVQSSILMREEENIEIVLGDILEYILTLEQRETLKNLVINGLPTDNFFNSLPREQQRRLQFIESDVLSSFTDTQRLEVLRYLERNLGTNHINHDFLREIGIIQDGLSRRQIEQNIETPLILEHRAITVTGRDLSYHERMRNQARISEVFGIIGAGAIPRTGGFPSSQKRGTSQIQNPLTRNTSNANPLDGITYRPKVQRQMRRNARTAETEFHAFPESVRGFARPEHATTIVGGDGIKRTRVAIPGIYKGKRGVFEFIIEPDGSVNHRQFIKGINN